MRIHRNIMHPSPQHFLKKNLLSCAHTACGFRLEITCHDRAAVYTDTDFQLVIGHVANLEAQDSTEDIQGHIRYLRRVVTAGLRSRNATCHHVSVSNRFNLQGQKVEKDLLPLRKANHCMVR